MPFCSRDMFEPGGIHYMNNVNKAELELVQKTLAKELFIQAKIKYMILYEKDPDQEDLYIFVEKALNKLAKQLLND